jgi:hypothetical protein
MKETKMKPLHQALQLAITACEAANATYDQCVCDERMCEHFQQVLTTEADVDAARRELAHSDEPRTWHLREDGYEYDTVEASSAVQALKVARKNVDRANYDMSYGTLWINVSVHCQETDEEAEERVVLAPEEPECIRDEHDWQSPIELVGGIEENPGVFGHGGGVIINEVCLHCGCARITDTWAQDRTTGEQGLRSVEYEEGKYDVERLER